MGRWGRGRDPFLAAPSAEAKQSLALRGPMQVLHHPHSKSTYDCVALIALDSLSHTSKCILSSITGAIATHVSTILQQPT